MWMLRLSRLVCLLLIHLHALHVGTLVIADGKTEQAKGLESRIKKKGGAGLQNLSKNLVDEIWGSERPERPNNPVMVLPVEYAGQPFQEKIEAVRKELEKKKSPGFVVSMLDEIAWLYNLRGTEYVFYSFPVSATWKRYLIYREVSHTTLSSLPTLSSRPPQLLSISTLRNLRLPLLNISAILSQCNLTRQFLKNLRSSPSNSRKKPARTQRSLQRSG